MRDDIKKVIMPPSGKGSSKVESGKKEIFRSYAPPSDVGRHILNSFKKYVVEHNGCNVFFTDDMDKKRGYLSNVYGNTGVLSLVNRMEVTLTADEKTDFVKNVCYILDYIEQYGYTLYPYITGSENENLFGIGYPFTGAATWTLSFLTSVRKAVQSELITLPDKYTDLAVKHIRKIIKFFNESVIRDNAGKPLGWDYTKDCKQPSLFFTYSVLEAYSDFDDNIMGAADSDAVSGAGRDVDTELLNIINKGSGERIEEEWRRNCYEVTDNVWNVYKDALRDGFVDDTFLEGFRTVTRDDIYKSASSSALFNNIFLVFILLYGYENTRNPDKDDVILTMNTALQNVQRVYDQLKKEGLEYVVDTYYIQLRNGHNKYGEEYKRAINPRRLVDATLLPLLVKANNTIAYYISQYPVKQMSELFDELFDNLRGDDWVWESRRYDVKITERYIEAVADFYMYYKDYEREYAEKYRANETAKAVMEERITKRVTDRFAAQNEQRVQAEIAAREEAIRAEYGIENAIRNAISSKTDGAIERIIRDVIEYNKSGKGSEFTKTVAELLPELVMSYVLKSAHVESDKSDRITEKAAKDVMLAVSGWIEKLSETDEVVSKIIEEN